MNGGTTRIRGVVRAAGWPAGILLALALAPALVSAQWTNRYPRVEGYGHQIYLEGYEMPTLTGGPIDPAASPDGTRLAFASHGWIWVMDLVDGGARRLTSGGAMDARPAWSPDGARIAFVRDDTRDTWIVVADAATGAELLSENTPAIELDPAFSADGARLYFASASAGTIDLWALELGTGEKTRVTDVRGIELKPQPGAEALVYLAKGGGGGDRVLVRELDAAGSPAGAGPRTLLEGSIASMARPALSPDGSTVAVNWPTQAGWELRLVNVDNPAGSILLVGPQDTGGGTPLTPAWSMPGGEWVYFSRGDGNRPMRLYRVPAAGGPAEEVVVRTWDWGVETGTLRVRTTVEAGGPPAAARLDVVDATGHPAVPAGSRPWFDGQSGRVYAYSTGIAEYTVPAGSATVAAVQGLATPEVARTVEVAAGRTTEVEVTLAPVWDARAAGWVSGEHHFHLNYGGPYDLAPADLVPMMRGEALDVATPLLANLHNRFEDQDLWGWERAGEGPLIRFGQEVRSHFLGHVGLIGIGDFFWPWVWGPGYQVYGTDDRENAEALGHARSRGGFGYYVHPVSTRGAERAEPWSEVPFDGLAPSVPIELVADAVLGDLDALEVVCLWSDETTTTQVWHRFLNLGIPVAPSAGTDVMNNFFRTMAVGTTRVYAMTGGQLNWPAYMAALREGRTFVSNGPFLEFRLEGAGPGGVVAAGSASWTLDLSSAGAVDRVDVLVNGEVAWQSEGLDGPGSRRYQG
ncbi:MAG: hypothetical protein F4179_03455, partial [Gammaproteobacteria bacterium]|nr:hypothetical protein [Gammaproteobacteria bacterium]